MTETRAPAPPVAGAAPPSPLLISGVNSIAKFQCFLLQSLQLQAPLESSSKDDSPGNTASALLAHFSPIGFSSIAFGSFVSDGPAVTVHDVSKNVCVTAPLISDYHIACLPANSVVAAHVDVDAAYPLISAPALALLPSGSADTFSVNFTDTMVSSLRPYHVVETDSVPRMVSLPELPILYCNFADLPPKSAIAAHVDIAAAIPISAAFPAALCNRMFSFAG